MGEVYKITNTVNSKCYIGITKHSFKKRYSYSKWWENPSINRLLKQSIDKYGIDNFKVEILEITDYKQLAKKEIYYIEKFNSFTPNGYNLTKGGDINIEVSIESKLKNRMSNLGRIPWNKGKKLSTEHVIKCKNTKKRLISEGKIIPWNKGLKTGKMSKEHINKSAIAHRKIVYCYDIYNNFIKKYNSLSETTNDGFNPSQVCLVCKNKAKSHKKHIFRYEKID